MLKCDLFENSVKLKSVNRRLHGTPENPSRNHITTADDYIHFVIRVPYSTFSKL